jgi:hypothetical protein
MPGNFATRNRNRRVGFGRIMRNQSTVMEPCRDKAMDGNMHAGRDAANPTRNESTSVYCCLLLGLSFFFMLPFVPTVVHVSPPDPRRRRGIESCTATARSIKLESLLLI